MRHRAAIAVAIALIVPGAPSPRAQTQHGSSLDLGDNSLPVGIEAENGIEWEQSNRVYIARGHATATRGDKKVAADTLYAFYRPVVSEAKPATASKGGSDSSAGGSTEVYRLEAEGNVRFTTPTQTITGDYAIYDLDDQTLVVTGKHLSLVTPRDTITARDSLEWYDTQQLGIARGDALAVRGDRRVRGDVLTALMEKPPGGASHISRIDASGNVMVSTPNQIARGDAGVDNLDTGIATLSGHVRLTRGENELRGRYAVVDTKTNVSRLLSAPPGTRLAGGPPPRVQGLLVPKRKPDTTGQPGTVGQPGTAGQ